ncbi:MAG: tetratricopeptide repeat protein [Myxococcota bacterium]
MRLTNPPFGCSRRALAALVACLGVGCAHRARPAEEPTRLEEMHITARPGAGGFATEAVDAETLFRAGVSAQQQQRFDEALVVYDRVVGEFPESRFVAPSLYNGGLSGKALGRPAEAAARFERLVTARPGSPDVRPARFQLAELYLELERGEDGLAVADVLLADEGLDPDERVEAMARKAQHLLALGRTEEAAAQAQTAMSWARTRRDEEAVRDVYFIAAANYVWAETLRLEAEAIVPPPGGVAVQRPHLERRAQVILRAQRSYFDVIRHTHPDWAAAAGYRIGQLYDDFWDAIMSAPVPPPQRPLPEAHVPVYEREYRLYLARLVKPLIRHSIRYWELTLVMVERTGVESDWTTRIRADLERARDRLLAQPEGPEGLDATRQGPEITSDLPEPESSQGSPEETPEAGAPG